MSHLRIPHKNRDYECEEKQEEICEGWPAVSEKAGSGYARPVKTRLFFNAGFKGRYAAINFSRKGLFGKCIVDKTDWLF